MSSTLKAAIIAVIGVSAGLVAKVLRHALGARPEEAPGPGRAPSDSRGAREDEGVRAGGGGAGKSDSSSTRAQLYEEARRRGVRGRSKMTKAELQAALAKGGWR